MSTPETSNLGERELQLLERLAAILNSLNQREQVLERVMDLFLAAMGAERGLLLEFGAAGEPHPLVVRNFAPDIVLGMTRDWSRSAVEQLTVGGTIVVSEDALQDPRFREAESVVSKNIKSLLCVPIRTDGQLKGAIYIDHRAESRSFSERDISFAKALAELSGVTLDRSEAMQALTAENSELRARAGRYERGNIIGASEAMQRVFDQLEKALTAPPEFAILITGPNGTGKTSIARLLHRQSDGTERPFVTFGSGAVPETLVESELFGHRRGSFTGAEANREGLVTKAEGGTLFIDDIDALPLKVQPKLLTFLQEREYRPIGGELKKANVRVICATNADLQARVSDGSFREDLFYRINGITIAVPALSERREDIPLLARHFMEKFATGVKKDVHGFTPRAIGQMMAYKWPGNVRELMGEVVQAVTMTPGPQIDIGDFKTAFLREVSTAKPVAPSEPADLNLEAQLDLTTENILRLALDRSKGNVSAAARLVGVSRGKFYDLLDRVGMRDAVSGRRRSITADASGPKPGSA